MVPRPKRIIFSVINDLTTDQRMHRICDALQKDGFEVTLVGRRLIDSASLPHFNFETKRIRCFFNRGKLFYLEYNLRLFCYFLLAGCDIYGAVDADTLVASTCAGILRRRPFTYDAHEFFTEVPEVHERKFTQRFWKWVEDFGIPRAAACYTVSEGLAARYNARYKRIFAVVRNIAAYYDPGGDDKWDGNVIIYQGAINRGRGLEELVEAMPGISARLLIAGEGDHFKSLKEQVKSLGLDQKVKLLGKLPPKELRELTSKAHLGYNVLQNDGFSYYHSLANKCFDYLQARIPVITSPFPEYAALAAKHPFFIFTTAGPLEIAATINTFFQDENLRETLIEACHKAAGILNWENEQAELLRIYRKL